MRQHARMKSASCVHAYHLCRREMVRPKTYPSWDRGDCPPGRIRPYPLRCFTGWLRGASSASRRRRPPEPAINDPDGPAVRASIVPTPAPAPTRPSIEADQPKIRLQSERGQICVCPRAATCRAHAHQRNPRVLDIRGLRLEAHTFIGKELTVDRDRLGRAQHILAHDLSVGQKAEERHLNHAAETNRSGGGIEPLAGSCVMFVPVRCGGDPDVNVGKRDGISRECHRSQR